MLQLSHIAQAVIALTIFIVWVPRFDNIVKEFKQYGLNDFIRSLVGTTKISLSTLLVTAIWYPELAKIPAIMMAGLMLCAQMAHFKVKNPWHKFLPSLAMLALSLFVAAVHSGMLQ
jgi:hypothetical protein